MMTLCWKSFHLYRRRTMRNSYQMQQELRGPALINNSATKIINVRRAELAAQSREEIGTISKNTQCDEAECSNGKTGKRATLELLI